MNISQHFTSNEVTSLGPKIAADPIVVPGCVVSIIPPVAGASDAYNRMAASFDLLSSHFDLTIEIEAYSNYHARDVDFDEVLGLRDGFNFVSNNVDLEELPVIDLSDLIKNMLVGNTPLKPHKRYRIRSDIYSNNPLYKELWTKKGLIKSFFSRMSYHAGSDPFHICTDGQKAVLHLRRQDISVRDIFAGIPTEKLDPTILQAMNIRKPNLDVARAIQALEQTFDPGTKVNIVIASDGFEKLKPYYKHEPIAVENVARLEAELQVEPTSDLLDINIVTRVIGTDPSATRLTMDAMYHADLVVTAYSSFPQLPCRFGNTPYLQLRFGAPAE